MIVTNAPVEISVSDRVAVNVGAMVVFLVEGESAVKGAGKEAEAAVDRLFAAGAATGKAKEIVFDLVGEGKKARRVYVAGLGKAEKISAEAIRQSAGAVLRALRKHKMTRVAIFLPEVKGISSSVAADAVATGIYLAAFDYREYKGAGSKEDGAEKAAGAIEVSIVGDSGVKEAVERA
jgi:leucyl aminopeptidase